MAAPLLGIYRERRFSPGRHAAGDADILQCTQAALARQGYHAVLIAPERLSSERPEASVVFAMCQSPEALAVLEQWESQGVLVLNTPAAIRACYRVPLVTALSQAALPFPRSVVMPVDETLDAVHVWPPLREQPAGCWVKRGDVHAMQADDVVLVRDADAWQAHLASFRQRGIEHAIVQEHLVGSEIKFYAVRGYGVVHYFAPHAAACPPIDPARLHDLVVRVGDILGLDVYGGDCILTSDDTLYLVDVNDWPSFRGCRELAAERIARRLLTRARERGVL
jgi:glutathione synthase/RimK-type ligase-like ATP-grasp enzyme